MRETSSSTPVWLWPNLLSVDAPLVAVVWQDFLARCFPSTLLPAGRWTLGLTVWAIYLADRLMDARHAAQGVEAARHRFYRRHFRIGLALLAVAVCADLVVASVWLRPAVVENGLWVGASVGLYLGVFARLRISRGRLKQICAAALFTAGIFLVAWTSIGQAMSVLAVPAVAFAALVLANLMLIEGWEQGRLGTDGWWWLVVLAAVVLWGWYGSRWFGAITLSGAGLAALNRVSGRLSDDVRHVLADAVLLTPLIL